MFLYDPVSIVVRGYARPRHNGTSMEARVAFFQDWLRAWSIHPTRIMQVEYDPVTEFGRAGAKWLQR
jgi:hypothetical protein